MKKKSIKNLSLNKIKVSKINSPKEIVGATTGPCVVTTYIISRVACSYIAGSCGCPPPPSDNCDHTRGCPSWNVACNQ
ncbi:hypothetical protein [Kordia sp.]|uniref:hypothetical protein n=1 Tax=Kordia sp. TaxID=1965332 RepID=UPI003D2E499C